VISNPYCLDNLYFQLWPLEDSRNQFPKPRRKKVEGIGSAESGTVGVYYSLDGAAFLHNLFNFAFSFKHNQRIVSFNFVLDVDNLCFGDQQVRKKNKKERIYDLRPYQTDSGTKLYDWNADTEPTETSDDQNSDYDDLISPF